LSQDNRFLAEYKAIQIGLIPTGQLSLALEAVFGCFVFIEHVNGDESYGRQVLLGVAGADSAAIFVKDNI
jgi:hypothetical protein